MLRDYYSVTLNPKNNDEVSERSISKDRERRHRLVDNRTSLINQRVQKIKNKYGAHTSLKQNFLSSQSMLGLGCDIESNKENQSALANCSVIEEWNEGRKRLDTKESKIRKVKKSTRDSSRIQQLEEINSRINKIIETLKCQESGSDREEEGNYDIVPTILQRPEQKVAILSSTKHSLESRRSRMRTQSLDCSHASNRSKSSFSNRENGKLSKLKAITKSYKELKSTLVATEVSQQERMAIEFSRQIELDEKFIKAKAALLRAGTKCKKLLEKAANSCEMASEERQMLVEWNFQDLDPLYTERSTARSTEQDVNLMVYSTVDCFLKCQDHWKRRITKKFNRKQLIFKDLDLEQKGYFLKQDLTRFLGLQTKKLLCNRHIGPIFKRINKKKNKIVPIQDFINLLCL